MTDEDATRGETGQNDLYSEEEVLEGDWMRPHVDMQEVEVVTGEENETIFWQHRAKLYRWTRDTAIWKERGLGEAKMLRHKVTNKIRFLLRQEKTLKIVANHYLFQHGAFCELKPHVSSDKIWVWSATDYSESEPTVELFGLKFGQVETAAEFKEKFNEAVALNATIFGPVAAGSAASNSSTASNASTASTAATAVVFRQRHPQREPGVVSPADNAEGEAQRGGSTEQQLPSTRTAENTAAEAQQQQQQTQEARPTASSSVTTNDAPQAAKKEDQEEPVVAAAAASAADREAAASSREGEK